MWDKTHVQKNEQSKGTRKLYNKKLKINNINILKISNTQFISSKKMIKKIKCTYHMPYISMFFIIHLFNNVTISYLKPTCMLSIFVLSQYIRGIK